MGASTGGPSHIQKLLTALEVPFDASIIIAQHMGAEYLPSFTSRLDSHVAFDVIMAEDGLLLQAGCAYICTHTTTLCHTTKGIAFEKKPSQGHYNPDIDALFASSCTLTSHTKIMGIILTGIGEDGAQGLAKLSHSGATCIAESPQSAIVYGMPMRAAELCSAVKILDLDAIIDAVALFVAPKRTGVV